MGRTSKLGVFAPTWLQRWPLEVALLQELNKFSVAQQQRASQAASDHSKVKSFNLRNRKQAWCFPVVV